MPSLVTSPDGSYPFAWLPFRFVADIWLLLVPLTVPLYCAQLVSGGIVTFHWNQKRRRVFVVFHPSAKNA
jgi:hypothetical protein